MSARDIQPLLLTVAEAADSTRMSPGYIKLAIRNKELQQVKFGRAVRIRVGDLEAWIRSKIAGSAESQGEVPAETAVKQVIETTTGVRE